LVAKALGGRVIGVDPIAARREIALRLGADEVLDPLDPNDPTQPKLRDAVRDLTRGEGADLAFETSGSASGQNGAVECLRLGGKAVFVGFGVREKTLNPSQFIGRQLTLIGSFVIPIHMYYDMLQFVLDHQLPLDEMVTHRFPIEAAPEAFALFDRGKTGKVVLEWD
jgi:propanol-preferring alcohol dehydrogenase